jgi:NAD(P)-dependent dehydrogenase (short-subunit alcohol dehydrogenase family)
VADVRDSDAVQRAVEVSRDAFGGLDALFANAGVGNVMPMHRYDDDEFERIVGVNLRGVFTVLRAVLPAMAAAGGGSVVTMASVAGVRATRGESPYAAAKAGVVALTQAAALEYAPTVRVNCVSPGFIATPLTRLATENEQLRAKIEAGTPLGRLGEADDVASVVVFLLSDLAGYITGQNVIVDGGSLLPSGQADPLLKGVLALYDQQ